MADLIDKAAVLAAIDANTPPPAGGSFSHTNSMRVVASDIRKAIAALPAQGVDAISQAEKRGYDRGFANALTGGAVAPDALHRSFPEAGDGRPMPPMGDELMTAGLSAEDARFVAVQLAQNGWTLAALAPAEAGGVERNLTDDEIDHLTFETLGEWPSEDAQDWARTVVKALLSDHPAEAGGVDGSALTVWYGSMPESNGRQNWTAMIYRKGSRDRFMEGYCFALSEYPDRVRYAADRMRWVIGELPERPDILAYDEKLHSGYVEPNPAPVDALVKAAEDAEYDLLQWLECGPELVKAGFNMDGTAEVVEGLRAALAAYRGAK